MTASESAVSLGASAGINLDSISLASLRRLRRHLANSAPARPSPSSLDAPRKQAWTGLCAGKALTYSNGAHPANCSCYQFSSDFACIGCDQKYEDHETLYETESERKALGKPIRGAYFPLTSDPVVQDETMKQLKVGPYAQSDEQVADQLAQLSLGGAGQVGGTGSSEEAKVVIQIQEDGQDGVMSRPGVTLIIEKKPIVRKHEASKPERSVQLMQAKGIGGQKAVPPKK
ncbi:hypothetical protein FGO68_gene11401 [Halteria grandinella]|uniref:Uncharacterized protein n=1 Tax=Halteria grandinella TaxID=5974 RepID=A0A8J8NYH2_HALGN|nr:hypothetical protein FGO68_gene11401 [Halteria grandinella]